MVGQRWWGQVRYSDTISALASRLTENCDVLIVNAALFAMLRMRMRIDAELTQRLWLMDLHSWSYVGMPDLSLKPYGNNPFSTAY